jgi:hypothetical protein
VAVVAWLIKGFALLVSAIAWLKDLSLFPYHAGHDPLTHWSTSPTSSSLGLSTLSLTALAMVGMQRRDLRA